MSRHDEIPRPAFPGGNRPRANTSSFLAQWIPKPKDGSGSSGGGSTGGGGLGPGTVDSERSHSPSPPSTHSRTPPTLAEVIETLSPPNVPSLMVARQLSGFIATSSPLPPPEVFIGVWASLCEGGQKPVAYQAAGFDALSAYWEHREAWDEAEGRGMRMADRLTYLSLFLPQEGEEDQQLWHRDLWEPRFKALRSVTRWGAETLGIETKLIVLVQGWMQSAFNGLDKDANNNSNNNSERERCITLLADFLAQIIQSPLARPRISDDDMLDVLAFYAGLVQQAMEIPLDETTTVESPTTGRPVHTHKRHTSSISLTSALPSPTLSISPIPTPPSAQHRKRKHPFVIAVQLYLSQLEYQLKELSTPTALAEIMPLLFRALSFCASPLPRLGITGNKKGRKESQPSGTEDGGVPGAEEQICDYLMAILNGSYAAQFLSVLKKHLGPPDFDGKETADVLQTAVQMSFGAHRTLRMHIRKTLTTRLVRFYISSGSSYGYSHSGAPANLDVTKELMESAWPREDVGSSYMPGISTSMTGAGWEPQRWKKALVSSIEGWVAVPDMRKEVVLEEVASLLKDIFRELDIREDYDSEDSLLGLDDDEAPVVGEILSALAGYLLTDSTGIVLPLKQPAKASTMLLQHLSYLLSLPHDAGRRIHPPLSSILLSVAEHISDEDTARIPVVMRDQNDLHPTAPDWLASWRSLLDPRVTKNKPRTSVAVIAVLQEMFVHLKDMKAYRRPLMDLAKARCRDSLPISSHARDTLTLGLEAESAFWQLLGEELVLRCTEDDNDDEDEQPEELEGIADYLKLLTDGTTCLEMDDLGVDELADLGGAMSTAELDASLPAVGSMSVGLGSLAASSQATPMLTRIHSEAQSPERDREKDGGGLPSIASLLSSFTTSGNTTPVKSRMRRPSSSSHSPSFRDQLLEERQQNLSVQGQATSVFPTSVHAVSALVTVFSQLSFSPSSIRARRERNLGLAIEIWEILLSVLERAKGKDRGITRLVVLSFVMRLRADRDHRVYWEYKGYDAHGQVANLATLIGKGPPSSQTDAEREAAVQDLRRARAKVPERDTDRRFSRGRGGAPSSRSRSRAPFPQPHSVTASRTRERESLWATPETFPFVITEPDIPSEALATYDPLGGDSKRVLPISRLLQVVISIFQTETNWEVLSYVLCHLPSQLANKHLFCGPKSRAAISDIQKFLCTSILDESFATLIDAWPVGLKSRDAQGLAYHTLSVMISYRICFEGAQRHRIVEVFRAGLDGQLTTIRCSLHALSLCAFELQASSTKYLTSILEKLSRIMSNPTMAVHILGFLSIVASVPPLYANFTEDDFKLVFGVALQYLQHHNEIAKSGTTSWALTQHVRIMSYYLLYVWFLAVKLPDRKRHIPFIARQLLLANEGNAQLDDYTEVCFDWLARYAYASADPRPTRSVLSDVVMNPGTNKSEIREEKTWLLGNSVVTIRVLTRLGWFEVLSRRPSGYTKFLCRLENAPMVGPGDVEPDMISVAAAALMERELPATIQTVQGVDGIQEQSARSPVMIPETVDTMDDPPARPDTMTGYVWSGTAPSQRRKEVAMDPSFFGLQLSAYPDRLGPSRLRTIVPQNLVPRFTSTFDFLPVIDTHKVGILYVAPGQQEETEILRNEYGSPAYTRFLQGIGRLINLRGQVDVYAGGLDPSEDGEYAYAWWDDIGQILYHTATLMPTHPLETDAQCIYKKRHIGNDYVRIVWNDSGLPYAFETLKTDFQFVNIVIESHSLGSIAAFSNNLHENEYFKVTIQCTEGMSEFAPMGEYGLISATNLPLFVRQISLLADWFAIVFEKTQRDTVREEVRTNWQARLEAIRKFRNTASKNQSEYGGLSPTEELDGTLGMGTFRDFTAYF